MLELKNIVKEYYTEDETVKALKGVNLKFRDSEFVSILGPSGCGKTTLLNIVGGLDRYTTGDLIINGKSTKDYKDKDWDTYRNHSVGFVFQSYNLIPHQTVLENVELALTLSGIGKEERHQRAKAVLEQVGLGNKLKSKPYQLSGGQMQRVAIARALINDPEILLADEPTGALDSKTSEQIMELLKEISKDRLIIMVTHNPEIAETYSTRIIRMLDGEITEDPNPITEEELAAKKQEVLKEHRTNKGRDKTSMSFKTALSLSLKNLLTKKTRTLLVSFAGSIGIIGIALILSLSSGFQNYINKVQEDTLSSYPLTIQSTTSDMNAMLENISGEGSGVDQYPEGENVYADETFTKLMEAYGQSQVSNNLEELKKYLENSNYDRNRISAIQYVYNINFVVHGTDVYGNEKRELYTAFEKLMSLNMGNTEDSGAGTGLGNMVSSFMSFDAWSEAIDNPELIKSQYDLVGNGSRWANFDRANEVMLVVDTYNQIPDYILPALGLMDVDELVYPVMEAYEKTMGLPEGTITNALGIKKVEPCNKNIKIEELLGKEFYITLPCEQYTQLSDGTYRYNEEFVSSRKVKIVGVIRPKEGVTGGALNTTLIYNKALTDSLLSVVENSSVIKAQTENPSIDVTTGKTFTGGLTYISNLDKFGAVDKDKPQSINIYAASFEDKDYIVELIDKYNAGKPEEEKIVYNDFLGAMMSSITDIIDAISYVLIGFVSVSLVVSSIMIGIITYISVLERIKEIGILRALGASKRDVSRVFNAETLIIGLTAGLLGIGVTVLLNIPISFIIYKLALIKGVAKLPWLGGVILVLISMGLTIIAGLIPSKIASKKDPVVALRSE
ncbi:MAG: ABC transporter ATP-binding protein/permease [Clostridia bacterium]|nr:ABC transporter ATP-binding protein/permease [Clostridia bacterium]